MNTTHHPKILIIIERYLVTKLYLIGTTQSIKKTNTVYDINSVCNSYKMIFNDKHYHIRMTQSIKTTSKIGDRNRGRAEGSVFNSYYTYMSRRALLLSLDCSTLSWICTLYCRVLSKEISSTIFKVFGMTRPGIEPQSPGLLMNTQPTRQWVGSLYFSVS